MTTSHAHLRLDSPCHLGDAIHISLPIASFSKFDDNLGEFYPQTGALDDKFGEFYSQTGALDDKSGEFDPQSGAFEPQSNRLTTLD